MCCSGLWKGVNLTRVFFSNKMQDSIVAYRPVASHADALMACHAFLTYERRSREGTSTDKQEVLRGRLNRADVIQNWIKLQNTGPLIYISLNDKVPIGIYFVLQDFETCKTAGPKWPCIL